MINEPIENVLNTMQGVFDELDLVEAFAYPGHALQIGEMTKKQKLLYETF